MTIYVLKESNYTYKHSIKNEISYAVLINIISLRDILIKKNIPETMTFKTYFLNVCLCTVIINTVRHIEIQYQ